MPILVRPLASAQGRRRRLQAAIERGRERGASSLFLGSSTKLPDAVHLYEALGFTHVTRGSQNLPVARASVFMRLDLALAR